MFPIRVISASQLTTLLERTYGKLGCIAKVFTAAQQER